MKANGTIFYWNFQFWSIPLDLCFIFSRCLNSQGIYSPRGRRRILERARSLRLTRTTRPSSSYPPSRRVPSPLWAPTPCFLRALLRSLLHSQEIWVIGWREVSGCENERSSLWQCFTYKSLGELKIMKIALKSFQNFANTLSLRLLEGETISSPSKNRLSRRTNSTGQSQ